jgi:hypothetical protein
MTSPDVIYTNGQIRNGRGMFSVGPLGVTTNHILENKINKTDQVVKSSGTLDYRLDDQSSSFRSSIAVTTANTGVIAAIPNQSFKILDYVMTSATNATISIYSGSTLIASGLSIPANGSLTQVASNPQFPILETSKGQGLNIVPSSGATIAGHLTYRIV